MSSTPRTQTPSQTQPRNQEPADASGHFGARMLDMLNQAMLAIMTSIGHRTGLFDQLADLPPSTSTEIARAGGLDERYVREWLGAMVTGGIVRYDPRQATYSLPAEHAKLLVRSAGSGNIATLMQWVPCMGGIESGIVESFRKGGGVAYGDFDRFHQIMSEVSGQTFDATLVSTSLPLVPGLVARLEAGIDVLDVGCGSGHAVNLMARAFPGSRFWGFEFCEEALAPARAEAEDWNLTNAHFEARDAAELRDADRYDLITAFDAIHDQADPARVLAGIARAVRPDGSFLMVDVAASSRLEENLGHPIGPAMYSISTMHCMSVSLGQRGEGLGAMWGEQKAREMLAAAGFGELAVHRVDGDIVNNYYIARKA